MGNKIGLEVTKSEIKLAIAQIDGHKCCFIKHLDINCDRSQLNSSEYTIFLFKSSIEEFLSIDREQLREKIRVQYQEVPLANAIEIRSNIETINIIERQSNLKNSLSEILGKQIILRHKQKIEGTISIADIFNPCQEIYNFSQNFKITQLNSFENVKPSNKKYMQHFPQNYLLVSLKNGLSSYKVLKKYSINRLYGSIIGEKTILNILKIKYPQYSLSQLLQNTFSTGKLQKTQLLVQDIYGSGVDKLNLPKDLVASSLGKLSKMSGQQLQQLSKQDITRSLLTALAINTGIHISQHLHKQKLGFAFILANQLHMCDDFYRMVQAVVQTFAPQCSVFFSEHAPFISCISNAIQFID